MSGRTEGSIAGAVDRAGRWGFVLPTFPQHGAPSRHLATVAGVAEEQGVDTLWACDHLYWFGPNIECFTALATAAAATQRCTLGAGVLQLPLRSTAAAAKAAASVAHLSGGRLVLGVGAGAHAGEYAAVGVPFEERGRLLDAGIDELRRHWRATDAPYAQLPAPPLIPIWVGGSSHRARRRAALRGDGWLPLFLAPDDLARAYEALDEELLLAGRPADSVTRGAMVFVSTGPDARAAADKGRRWLSRLYRVPSERFDRHLVAGEPGRCADALDRYRRAGADHIAVFIADDEPLPQLAALARTLEEVSA